MQLLTKDFYVSSGTEKKKVPNTVNYIRGINIFIFTTFFKSLLHLFIGHFKGV